MWGPSTIFSRFQSILVKYGSQYGERSRQQNTALKLLKQQIIISSTNDLNHCSKLLFFPNNPISFAAGMSHSDAQISILPSIVDLAPCVAG